MGKPLLVAEFHKTELDSKGHFKDKKTGPSCSKHC